MLENQFLPFPKGPKGMPLADAYGKGWGKELVFLSIIDFLLSCPQDSAVGIPLELRSHKRN